ncbi:MAG: GspH/FimT family pseudopilin [bacterium]
MNVFCVKNDKTKRARPFRFTLIELLVVVAIMGVIIAVSLPAFEKLTIGSGVDATARQLNAQLRLARQYAISNRCKVAVVMPQDGINASSCYACFRSAAKKGSANYAWIANTNWTFLPTGAAIYAVTGGQTVSNSMDLTKIGGGATVSSLRAVIFKSTGALDGNPAVPVTVTIREAVRSGTNWIQRNTNNQLIITINAYTGKTTIQ